MAEMDPETAFLEAMKAEPVPNYSNGDVAQQAQGGYDEEEDYDPSNLMPDDAYNPAINFKSPSEQSSASVSESPTQTPTTTEAVKPKPAEASGVKQPRTVGGFVVESEDDEDEVPITKPKAVGATLNVAQGSSDTAQRSLSQTPSNTLAPSNVPLHSAPQDQGLSGVQSSSVTDTVPNVASSISNVATPVPDAIRSPQVPQNNAAISATSSSLPKARLPNDRIGMLEDRISEDPRGDVEAWLSLISEYRKRNKLNEARAVYDRFFKVFPSTAEEWVNYINMESELENFLNVEQIFKRSIVANPHVELWSTYLDYVRRRNNLTTDPSGNARSIVTQAYEFVLQNVGIDRDAGKLWLDYIEFVKSGPGVLGGTDWQGQQKMDTLRKVYHRAIQIPTLALQNIWKQYDQFEMGLNKATGRKFMQEKAPLYMTARTANNQLDKIAQNIVRTTYPKLPPAPGFDGDTEYMTQVQLWSEWIKWEKEDPLVLKDEDIQAYRDRILYVYRQALMALRFWPEMWYDAAEYCFQNDMNDKGMDFLTQGVEANPESCLLAFRLADRTELSGEFEEGETGVIRKGEAVRAPFDKLLNALYELLDQTKKREDYSITRLKETFAQNNINEASDNDDDDAAASANAKEAALQVQIKAIQAGYDKQGEDLKRQITYAWINLMRVMRRVQGKGKPDAKEAPGFRGIFAQSRKRGRLLSDAYAAAALIEHHCYQDPAATKIFERGMKLFPEDENFALEFIKHLIKINDTTNARAVFETVVSRLTQKPEKVYKAKQLFSFFHEYESQYGELGQITKLEQRMSELFPEDQNLSRFAARFKTLTFDPKTARPIISPATQMRPKLLVVPSIEEPVALPQQQKLPSPPVQNSPKPVPAVLLPISNSPKRPLDESDGELNQPRKIARGESPLKGAAGRRLDAARRNLARASESVSNANISQIPPPQPLPRDVNFLLTIIPGAHTYKETRFDAGKMVELLRNIDLARANQNQLNQQRASAAPPQIPVPPVGWSPVPNMPPNFPPNMPPMHGMPGQMGGYGYQR